MILDGQNLFSYNQSVAQAIGSYDSTNIIDVGELSGIPSSAAGGGARDIGADPDLSLKIHVSNSAAVTSGGAGTLQVSVQGAPDNGSGAPGTYTTYYSSAAIPVTSLTAPGRIFDLDVPRPPAGAPLPRYYKLVYTIAGAALTGGTVVAAVVLDRPIGTSYPAGINIAV